MSTGNGKPDPAGIRLLVFDLDGTLIDSKLDLALAVNATRDEYGLGELPHENIFGFIGDGARAPYLIDSATGTAVPLTVPQETRKHYKQFQDNR